MILVSFPRRKPLRALWRVAVSSWHVQHTNRARYCVHMDPAGEERKRFIQKLRSDRSYGARLLCSFASRCVGRLPPLFTSCCLRHELPPLVEDCLNSLLSPSWHWWCTLRRQLHHLHHNPPKPYMFTPFRTPSFFALPHQAEFALPDCATMRPPPATPTNTHFVRPSTTPA